MSGHPTPSPSAPPSQVRALQAALTAEYVAIFGYGVAGAHLTGRQLAQARRAWNGHQATRDQLAEMVARRGAAPVAAATSYHLPVTVHDRRSAVALAAHLEDLVATAYLGLVGLDDPALRSLGARGLRASALRATAWRGTTLAFPGLAAASRPPGAAASPSP